MSKSTATSPIYKRNMMT